MLLSISHTSFAQQYYTYELVNIEERANFGSVQSLYQDSTGIIWLGHLGRGLEFYNGKKIERFHLENEGAFADKLEVFVEYKGLLYLNYGDEVKVFNPITQELTDSISIGVELPEKGEISLMRVDSSGDIWAIYEFKKTDVENPQTFYYLLKSTQNEPFQKVFDEKTETKGEPIIKLLNDHILIKNTEGIVKLNSEGKIFKTYNLPKFNLIDIHQENCSTDETGKVWLARGWNEYHGEFENSLGVFYLDTYTSEVTLLDSYGLNRFFSATTFYGRRSLDFLKKIGDYLFISGLRVNLKTRAVDYLKKESIKLGKYHLIGDEKDIYVDESGVIYVVHSFGFGKYVPQPDVFEIIPIITTRGFVEDEKGFIYGGLTYHYKGGGFYRYDPATNEAIKITSTIQWYSGVYHDGKIHGSRSSVVDLTSNRLSNVKEEHLKVFRDISTISNIKVGKDELWKTSWGFDKILVFDLNSYAFKKSIPIPALTDVYTEINDFYVRPSDGTVWMGTQGKGLFVFSPEGKEIHHFTITKESLISLRNSNVSSFYEDKERNMWIGHGSGISKINVDFSSIQHFVIDEERPDFYLVYGILPEDDDRFLWLSTNKGIFRFDSETRMFMDFPLNPTVMDKEYNRTSYHKSKNGRMYLGGENPTQNIAFYPNEVISFYENTKSARAKITIDQFSKYDRKTEKIIQQKEKLQILSEIVLNPGDRYFNLEFLLADYRSPKDNYYSFYLEGYEKEWSKPQRNGNKVRYENLPPGDYILKMRGALMRQNLPLNERQIKITVLPYWYQTLLAKLLLGFVLAAGFYGFYHFQMRRQLELQESIRLRDLDNLKTRLYTNITHEFRTPLTIIMGMNDNIKGFDQERNLIKRNTKNLLRLINQLLDLSKLDSGTLKMDAVQGEIVGYLQYLTESFYSMASDKKVNLSFKSNLKPIDIDFDEVKIQHIIYNLLSNAIKFTRPGGKVVLEVKEIQYKNLTHLQITVKDTGVGIEQENLPHIFDRFYQVERSNSKNGAKTFGGTGIGLALTKELVELMGGSIFAKSEIGWGTEFKVLLPKLKGIHTPKMNAVLETITYSQNDLVPDFESLPKKPDQIVGNKPQVLVVEDNAGVVTYIRSLLQNDYHIQVAINGQEGIDMALEHIPDLIISDVMMPEKNGYEVCATLKNDERTSHIPIIMLTAKADITSKIEGIEMGAEAYLSKPFEKMELLTRVRKLLELRKNLQARYSNGNLQIEVEPNAIKLPTIENRFLQKLQTAVEDRLNDSELSIPELCKAVHLSHTQLYRKLKALTGKTPSQFIRTVRLNKAMILIKESDLNISEIAYDVGFSDPNYFARMFKQEFGKSASEVRNIV